MNGTDYDNDEISSSSIGWWLVRVSSGTLIPDQEVRVYSLFLLVVVVRVVPFPFLSSPCTFDCVLGLVYKKERRCHRMVAGLNYNRFLF